MKSVMRRRLAIVLVLVILLVGAAVGFNMIKAHFIRQAMAQNASLAQTVSTTTAEYSEWQPQVQAVGSLRAIHGVEVTTEVAGLVRRRGLHVRRGRARGPGAGAAQRRP